MKNHSKDYYCWLDYNTKFRQEYYQKYNDLFMNLSVIGNSPILDSIKKEIKFAATQMFGITPEITNENDALVYIVRNDSDIVKSIFSEKELNNLDDEGFMIKTEKLEGKDTIFITASTDKGLLYGTFRFLMLLKTGVSLSDLNILNNPQNTLRIINHWDNLDGSIERGYAGKSIFYDNNELNPDLERVEDYARLLSSIGINSIAINNVNVHREESKLIGEKLNMVETLADIFRRYGIKVFLSINFASPIELGGLDTADPLDKNVINYWEDKVKEIYSTIPDFGGFLVKADSENRPGPFTYNRSHAEGANMLAEALKPYEGLLIWRCFVYNCQQDWRDYKTDRARAAYDNFKPLDGQFIDNVILQIKNGPMDFQVREPVSPLFGALESTNQLLELQITQEYTGQQRHLCYLVPQWKEVLNFDTYAAGIGSEVKRIIDGSIFPQKYNGFAAVVNVGRDENWTGHTLAQANLYGYGRLAWNPDLEAEDITDEWIKLTFGNNKKVIESVSDMLLSSWEIYESYTTPLGIGWMVNPGHHYGPSVEGYEYSKWGTYHRADHFGIGVDRTIKNGTGYTGQYYPENAEMFESMENCPEELLLFFHHVPYTYRLKSGKTLIQYFYDSHFEGVEQVKRLIDKWAMLEDKIDPVTYIHVMRRMEGQLRDAKEWRDVINSYFYRKTGIEDKNHRPIY